MRAADTELGSNNKRLHMPTSSLLKAKTPFRDKQAKEALRQIASSIANPIRSSHARHLWQSCKDEVASKLRLRVHAPVDWRA